MAIGDNIPDIFADLPNSVMRVGTQTGGNPIAIAQYVLDLFEGRDADTELSLTQQGAIDGAPMPNGGPVVDQYLLETGDPSMAITMAVDGALTGGADATDPNEIKAGMAATYIADITPLFNDMDSELIGQISTDLGITDNDLVAALQDISTQNMLAAPSSISAGEGVFNPLPNLPPTPVLPPPTPVPDLMGEGPLLPGQQYGPAPMTSLGPAGVEIDPSTSFPGTEVISPAMMAQDMPMPLGDDLSSLFGAIAGLPGVGPAGEFIAGIPGAVGDILQSTPYAGDEPTALPSIAGLPRVIGETIGITPSEEALAGEDDFLVRSRANIFGMPFSQNIPAPTQYQTPPSSTPIEDIGPEPFKESGIYPSIEGTRFDRALAAIKVQYDRGDLIDMELERQLEQAVLGELDPIRRKAWEEGEATARLHVGQSVQDIITEWSQPIPYDPKYGPSIFADMKAFEAAAERARQQRAGYTVEPYVAPPSTLAHGDPGTALDQYIEAEVLGSPAPIRPSVDYGQEISVPSPSPALIPGDPRTVAPVTPSPTIAPVSPTPYLAGEGPLDYRVGQQYGPVTTAQPGAFPAGAGIYTDVAPGRAQWQAWMPSVVEAYGMGNVQSAYSPGFSPFYGTYLLSQEYANEPAREGVTVGQGFPDYMEKYQPQRLGGQDWSNFEGQYKRLIDYSRASETARESGRNLIEDKPVYLQQQENNLMQNMGMANTVRLGTASEKKQYALAVALARYYKGASVMSNYATRGVEKTLGDIYDRIETQTLRERPGANPLTRFMDYLVDVDPSRFGTGEESVAYAP